MDLVGVARVLGYDLDFVRTPGSGYHHTLTARAATGNRVQHLPTDLATALSNLFRQQPNPALVQC